jgi:hypothetical protein
MLMTLQSMGQSTEYTECHAGFLSCRPNWLPRPLARKRVLPPPFGSWGGHTRLLERGRGEPIRTKGQTLWYSTGQRKTVKEVGLNVSKKFPSQEMTRLWRNNIKFSQIKLKRHRMHTFIDAWGSYTCTKVHTVYRKYCRLWEHRHNSSSLSVSFTSEESK